MRELTSVRSALTPFINISQEGKLISVQKDTPEAELLQGAAEKNILRSRMRAFYYYLSRR